MATVSTIVVFHDTAAPLGAPAAGPVPGPPGYAAGRHLWAGVDEGVRNSRALPCEACALLRHQTASEPNRGGNHEP